MFRKIKTRISKAINNPKMIIIFIAYKGLLKWMPSKLYLKLLFYLNMGKKLNIDNPITFNEKLQWLKLYDCNPLYTQLVDKYKVRKYIAETIGEQHLIPLIGVYDSFDQIDFNNLPNEFVLKCTHDSGSIVVCKDKSKLDFKTTKKILEKNMRRNYYPLSREWPYKNIKPRIICEKFMVDESGTELKDYKFFCFNGEPKALFVATDRGIDTRFDFFDLNFNHLPFMQHYKNGVKKIVKPSGLDKMIKLSKILSKGIPHVRVDLYDIYDRIYFGELTFFHFSGFEKFEPEKYDKLFGSWLELPSKMCK